MGRLKVTEGLIRRAEEVIGKGSIRTNEGIHRRELRALERAGIVKKSKVFGKRKFVGYNPQMQYIWEMKEKQ